MEIRDTGVLEFGERGWDQWVVQLYFPTITFKSKGGFQIIFDLLTLRIDPKNKAYGLVLFGFGIGMQKACKKPVPEAK